MPKFCYNCGSEISSAEAKFCRNCGAQIQPSPSVVGPPPVQDPAPPPAPSSPSPSLAADPEIAPLQSQPAPSTASKSPFLATLLSFILPGIGQIYNGQAGKGVVLIIFAVLFGFLSLFLIGIPLYLVLWVAGMFDAHKTANLINQGYSAKDLSGAESQKFQKQQWKRMTDPNDPQRSFEKKMQDDAFKRAQEDQKRHIEWSKKTFDDFNKRNRGF